jgi:hypothetical protein
MMGYVTGVFASKAVNSADRSGLIFGETFIQQPQLTAMIIAFKPQHLIFCLLLKITPLRVRR